MSELNISTQIGTIPLNSCLYNASGPLCTTKEELHALGNSAASAVLSKSCTQALRAGNPSPRYIENEYGSINSMGLPNKGVDYYLDLQDELAAYNKPYMLSVAGLSLEENLFMLEKINKAATHIAAIELNLSCPNVPGKPQTAYDFARTEEVLEQVFEVNKMPLGVKLPPYFDLIHFHQMAEILNKFPLQFVTCINSIGNGLWVDVDTESVVIKPKGGFGGIGGDYIKPTALANVRKFRELLKETISIIGCGGVKSGRDVFEHILCGADAVQVGTWLMRESPTCFTVLEDELKVLMKQKGYTSIDDFKGKLKTI